MMKYKHIVVISVYDSGYNYSVAIDNWNYCREEIENKDIRNNVAFSESKYIGYLISTKWNYQSEIIEYIRTHHLLKECLIVWCEDGDIEIYQPVKERKKNEKKTN